MLRKPPDCRLSRAIIEGAIAYAREANLRMAVAVVDHAGNVVAADRMDGASLQNIRFAEGKAFASALYRQTREWRRTSGKHEIRGLRSEPILCHPRLVGDPQINPALWMRGPGRPVLCT